MASDRLQRRARLRTATRQAHERLDTLVQDLGLLKTPERYAHYLHATWTARRPSELALDATTLEGLYPAWNRRRIGELLGQDILDVSSRPPPFCGEAMTMASLGAGQALGVLYVLEGSALGARLLEERAAAIGMTAAFGARHMARQTGEPGAWPRFLGILERTTLEPSEEDDCVEAAVELFQGFETAFAAVS